MALKGGPPRRAPAPRLCACAPGRAHKARGYILVVSLLVLLLMGIIAASLLKGNVAQEAVAGNVAGKVRAQEAADSALNYAEAWLTVARNASSGVACTAGGVTTAPVVCNATSPSPGTFNPNELLTPPGEPGAIGTKFIEPSMAVSTSGGVNDYYRDPRYYIQFISIVTDGSGTPVGSLYRITAGAYGGNADQVAIVEAYYKIYSPSTATTGP